MKDIDFSIIEQVRIIVLHLRGSDLCSSQILPLNKSNDLKNQDIEVEEQLRKFKLTVISHKRSSKRNGRHEEEIEHIDPRMLVIGLLENMCSPYCRDPDRSNNEEGYEIIQKLITLAHDVLNEFALTRNLTPVWYFKR